MECKVREGKRQCVWWVKAKSAGNIYQHCINPDVESSVKKACNGKLDRPINHKGTWCEKGELFCQEGFCENCEIGKRS